MTQPAGVGRAGVSLAALSFATFVAVTSEMLPIGLLPTMARGLDVSTSAAGLSVSIFAVLVAALAIPMTAWTDRVPRKTLLLMSLAGYVVSNLVVAFAPDFAVMLVGRAIGGLAHAVFYSVVTAYATALVPAPRIGRAISIVFAGASLGAVLGVPLTTFVGTAAGWRSAFVLMAVVAGALALVIAIGVPGVASAARHDDGSRYRPGRGLVVIVIADVLVFLGHHAAYTYIAPLLGRAGVPEDGLSAALLFLGVVSTVGLLLAGLLADRHLKFAFAGSAGLIALMLLVIAVVSQSLPGTLAAAAVWCIAYNAISALLTTAVVRSGAVSASTAGAVVNGASNLGITLGSLLGGGIIAIGAFPALPLVGAAIAGTAAVIAVVSRKGFPRGRD
jgi:predicted MFS family arabinose efflux permease